MPAVELTRELAHEKLFSSSSVMALAVPSAMVPEEWTLVMNPLHRRSDKIVSTVKKLGKQECARN